MPFTAQTLTGFILSALLLALIPGPDNLYVLTQSALAGWRAGFAITLGLCTGLLGHTLAVAIGVAAIIQTSDWAFIGLKLFGAGYLLFLCYQSIKASRSHNELTGETQLSHWARYRRGVLMNLSNPKVMLFFLAFLPQFTQPEQGQMALQIVILGGLFIACTLLVFGSIALAAGYLSHFLFSSPKAQRWLNWLAAAIFLILALSLPFSTT